MEIKVNENIILKPIESDHELELVNINEVKEKMFDQMQEWAMQIACKRNSK